MSVDISITDQIVEINETSNPVQIGVAAGAAGTASWGGITGTLSNQTDLQNALNAKFDDPTGTTSQYLRGDGTLATFPTIPSGTVTSVGLTMPSAFSVANSPVTSSGTLAVTGAGTAAQYIRGDGQLANFPDNQGGGSSVNYYLNGSVNQGTFGGDTYYEMSKTPVLGAGTNFTRTNAQGNGYIASFITDAGDPSLLNIPAGNWNVEFYFQANSNAGNPQFYAELYKVDASNNFTLVGSGSTNPEGITNGTTIDQYYTAIPVPQTSLLVTDRLAIRIFVITSGRTITLHTENSNLCEVITTLSTGLNALNGLTAQVQYFATGTSGTDFAISSATDTHTFNLPTASATNRGALSSADWSSFNSKQNALTNPITGTAAAGQVAYFTGATTQAGSNNLFWDNANKKLAIGVSPTTLWNQYSAVLQVGQLWLLDYQTAATAEIVSNSYYDGTNNRALRTGGAGSITFQSTHIGLLTAASVSAGAIQTLTEKARLTNSGNLLIGSTTDSGEKLQVTGTAKITGASSFGGNMTLSLNQNGSTQLIVSNAQTGTNSQSSVSFVSNVGSGLIGKYSSTTTTYKTVAASDLFLYNNTSAGDISILNDFPTGSIKFAAGGSPTAHITLTSVGSLGIGATSVNASAILQADSTTKGFLPPRMTTTQKLAITSPATGLQVYDTTLNLMSFYNGSTWVTGGGASTGVANYVVQHTSQAAYADNTTYYFGATPTVPSAVQGAQRGIFNKTGTVKSIYLFLRSAATPTSEAITVQLWKATGNGTLTSVYSSTFTFSSTNNLTTAVFTGLSISVIAGDTYELSVSVPNMITNPSNVFLSGEIEVEF